MQQDKDCSELKILLLVELFYCLTEEEQNQIIDEIKAILSEK